MLFPNIGPQYIDEKNGYIKTIMENSYNEGISMNQTMWDQGALCGRYEAGDQSAFKDTYGSGSLPFYGGHQYSFNRIRPTVNMISGHQRRNRKSIKATGVENGDTQTADQLTKVLMWINNTEGVLNTVSDAFHGSLISGMNLLHVWMDYRTDPISGNIKVDNCAYSGFLIDPFFRKHDLADCNFIWKRSFLTKREVLSLMPDKDDEIAQLQGNESGTPYDARFNFMPETYGFSTKRLLAYDEYYYRDYRRQRMLIDTQTGETIEWRSKEEAALSAFLSSYPQITVIDQDIPTVNLAIVIQGRVFYNAANPSGIDLYPFCPVFAYYRPDLPYFNLRIQSVVTSLIDPQFIYNHRKLIELKTLESVATSGYIFKENALVNPRDVWTQTGEGRGIAIKAEAQMTDVQQIIPPVIPPTTLQVSQIMSEEMNFVSGVNQELMGSALDDKAGVLSMLRQGAGLTTLQGLFDQLDYSQKLLGKIMIEMIQANFTPGKIKRIIEEEPTPQFHDKNFGRYDAVIEDGFNTSTQRQMGFAQLLQLKELGLPIPDESIIDAATLENKKQLMDIINKNKQEAMQTAQKQQELQMAQLQAQIELSQARALADKGLYVERASRVEENRAMSIQKLSEANKNDEQALLEKVKILKELEAMDLNHIERLLTMSNALKLAEQSTVQESRPIPLDPAAAPPQMQQPQTPPQPGVLS